MTGKCECCGGETTISRESGKKFEQCVACGAEWENGEVKAAPRCATQTQLRDLGKCHDKDALAAEKAASVTGAAKPKK